MFSALCVLLLSAASASAEAPVLSVLSATPAGSASSSPEAIVVAFNQPMVALASPADMGRACPLKLSPAVAGRCRWRGTQVLAFEPAAPLPLASGFRAVLPAGVKSEVSGRALERQYEWSFETPRPRVLDSRPRDGDRWIAPEALLFVHFDQTMDPKRARDAIVLREESTVVPGLGSDVPVGVRRATPEEVKEAWPWAWGENVPSTATVLALKPGAPLRRDHSYRLVLKAGLRAADGELGTTGERAVRFETPYAFRVVEGPGRACLPRGYRVSLTNPVRMKDLLAHASVEGSTRTWPADEAGDENVGNRRPRERRVDFELPDLGLAPGGEYALVISSGLRDAFGEELRETVRLPFGNDGYCPRLEMPGGFGVLEQGLPARHPVTAVNVRTAGLRKALIPDDQFVPFYRGIQWGCKEELVDAPEKPWNLGLARDASLRTFVDLGPLFATASPPRAGGFAAVQVLRPDGCREKAVLDVTRVGVSFKTSPDSTLVWATYLKTGLPAAGAPVELRDDDNKVLWRGRTDRFGLADAPGWKALGIKDWKKWSRPNLWAFVKDPKGTAALSLDWRGGLEPWRFDIQSDFAPRPRLYRATLFTERGVYRAGETVHVKGLVRKLDAGDWRLLGDQDPRLLVMTLTDARGAEVARTSVTVSGFSSFDHSFALGASAATGRWTVRVREPGQADEALVRPVSDEEGGGEEGDGEDGGGSSASGDNRVSASRGFRVEAFKPAAFEVKAVPSTSSWLTGDRYDAGIEGWWLFGAPMAGEKFSWTVRLEPSGYQPPGWDGFSFASAWRKRRAETGRLASSGEGDLDANGRAKAAFTLTPGDELGPMSAVLEASVVSPERQRLFGRASSVVHRANLYYGIRSEDNFVELGSSWTASVAAVRPDGAPARSLGADWTLRRREWLSVERAGVAGRLEWVSEEHETVVATGTFAASPSTWTWSWTPDKPGLYEFSVAGKDEQGRPAETQRDFNVAGAGEAWWKRSDNDIVELVADKDSYKPGQTARLLVKSPFASAKALVTVEREGILSRWTQTLSGGASLIRVPLDDRAVPDVFVSVTLVRGRAGKPEYDEEGQDLAKPQAKFGYKMLAVDPGGRRLKVTLTSDKGEYRPGAPLFAKVRVIDADGKPAAAEVALFAVDEGVLNLTSYLTPDPFEEFYGPRPLLVGSADSRPFVIGQRSFGEKGKNRGGGGGRGSPLPGVDLRANFSPTAFWGPTLQVGAVGVATATFKLPDSLTRFRLMAVAHEARKFGSGESRVTVSKPLSLRPSLPRLARVGDEFEGGVVIHNFSKQDSTVTVALALDGTAVAVEGAASREVLVPAGRAVETTWKCRATGLGSAEFRFAAKAGEESDGLRWTVPVRATERLERAATSGVADAKTIEMIARPTNAAPGGTLEASFSPTALSGLSEGARYLLEYPYGCLEQRLSRVVPVVTGADLVSAFGLGTMGDLKGVAQKELMRMPDFQHPSGGYGYWPSPWQPDPWLTAYALETAALARREGYAVPDDSLRKASAWLKTYLASDKLDWAYPYAASEDYASRAYAVYALGLNGEPQPAYFRKLYDRRDQLPYLAKAYLLKAAKAAAGEREAKTLADELLSQARVEARGIHFEDPEGERFWWIHGSDARTTAVALQAFLEARGGFPGDEKAARWLVEERKAKGRWRTTVENAASLRALQDFYRRYEKETPSFTALLSRDGEGSALWSERFEGRTLTARRKSLPLNEVLGGKDSAKLAVIKEGIGRLYYDLVMSYAPASFDKPAAEGFEVDRKVEPLRGGGLSAGKRAKVTLTVRTKQDRTFVALEDPLPAGWEIVDPTFAVEGAEDARALADEGGRGHYWGSFQRAERYDDRIQVFADFLEKGEHKWSYLIQATTPGKYHVPAAVVEQMYEPEVFGRTASGTAEVAR